MAQVISVPVLANPNDTDFAGQTNPCPTLGIGVNNIMQIAPATASQVSAYPAAVSQIIVKYQLGAQLYTGSYITGTAVGTLITACNA